MFLELLGLGTVAWGLTETRRLFSEPGLIDVAKAWLKEFPSFHRHVRIVAGTGHIRAGGAAVTGFGTVLPSPSAFVEQRLAMLEKNLDQTNTAVHQLHKKVDEEAQERKHALEAERQSREADDKSNRDLLREAMAVVSPGMWKIKWHILPVDEVHDQPAAQAATGGTRHGHGYQGSCVQAGA